jgi:hypothetical protein
MLFTSIHGKPAAAAKRVVAVVAGIARHRQRRGCLSSRRLHWHAANRDASRLVHAAWLLLCPPEHLYAGNDTETELQLHLEESYDAHAPHADET